MILLCGIASESPLALVRARLEEMGIEHLLFHQRRFDQMRMWFEVDDGEIRGELAINGRIVPLESITGAYVRLMDDSKLPELRAEPDPSPRRQHARELHQTLQQWLEIAPIPVLNRVGPMGSNASKPYQAQLIACHGFRVPETLVTNDPDAVRDFLHRCGRLVYKSISGTRSIVRTLDSGDDPRLDLLRHCPVQFQEFVEGVDVRVHTVGRDLFATEISSAATDYRYARKQVGSAAELSAVELSDDVRARCLALSEALRLPLSGIDLRIAPDDEVYCFEVNPSPGYSYYESNTGQPISRAIARNLALT
jgi:glutathione synthase/RimK-type ligase-like ATP-grasp enzyme